MKTLDNLTFMESNSDQEPSENNQAGQSKPDTLKTHNDSIHRDLAAILNFDARNELEAPSLIQLFDFKLLPDTPDAKDAVAFIESAFRAIGIGFHPDTDFADYVNLETEQHLFNQSDSLILNSHTDRACEILNGHDEDAYEVCVRLAQQWYTSTRLDADEMIEVDRPNND